ncbi:hypothetical protein [Bacillus phage BSTP8]|nr:hypothetical protein BSTP5_047 [Bacillus phage BSTP5]QRI44316.1 hypothetical protein [Bacillus phage BSTP8]QRI44452.1 hypothetical protein [Bacillus phage BSTP10]QRI44500.1 hypothetical protein [Bacillus phage BSTP12]
MYIQYVHRESPLLSKRHGLSLITIKSPFFVLSNELYSC